MARETPAGRPEHQGDDRRHRDGPFYARAVEHIQEGLREKLGGSEVTVEGAMGEMGLDYFTAYHVIRRLEREGELLPEEGITGIREWHWSNNEKDVFMVN